MGYGSRVVLGCASMRSVYDRLISSQLYRTGEWFSSRDMGSYIHVNKTDIDLCLRDLVEKDLVEVLRERKGMTNFVKYRSKLVNRELVNKRFSKGPTITYADAHINPWMYHDIKRSEYTKATCR
jgi:DNA-binding transcriptional regulator YhcF (GntR family)